MLLRLIRIGDEMKTELHHYRERCAELEQQLAAVTAERDEAVEKLGQLLFRLTNGQLSKTGYSVDDMERAIDDVYNQAVQPELSSLRSQVAAMREAFIPYVEWFGPVHDEYCPEDDTCHCLGKPINDAVNAALASHPGDGGRGEGESK